MKNIPHEIRDGKEVKWCPRHNNRQGLWLDISSFATSKNTKDGFARMCRDCEKINRIVYRSQRRDYLNQLNRKSYNKNKEKRQTQNREWYKKNSTIIVEKSKKYKREKSELTRLRTYQYSAKKRSIPFVLTDLEFYLLISKSCFYCGCTTLTMGIDRKDNKLGYLPENSLPCCSNCNQMKSGMTYTGFFQSLERIYNFQTKHPFSSSNLKIKPVENIILYISAINKLFRTYERRARKGNIPFSLSKESFFFLVKQPCAYCGISGSLLSTIFYKDVSVVEPCSGIDRVDNTLGYIEGNVVPCCTSCNSLKSDRTLEYFLQTVNTIIEYQNNA